MQKFAQSGHPGQNPILKALMQSNSGGWVVVLSTIYGADIKCKETVIVPTVGG
jgi:hypothetical protein